MVLCIFDGCNTKTVHREITSPDQLKELNTRSDHVKIHLKNGGVYVLKPWVVDTLTRSIVGDGVLLNAQRDTTVRGHFQVSLDSAVVLETNQVRMSGAVAVLSIVTAAAIVVSVYCLSNPKACFGSCPTFYATDGQDTLLQAEGFSTSVAPSLIATDRDALYRLHVQGPTLDIEMRNEALETHVIHRVNLLAAEKSPGGRVVATVDGAFWKVSHLQVPSWCGNESGDWTDEVSRFDAHERTSLSDSVDLATKEYLTVEFDSVPAQPLALLVASRQSLLSTYLFYQCLAYMGTTVGEWFAYLERNGAPHETGFALPGERLGWVNVQVLDSVDRWTTIGHAGETGPLATNLHAVPLPPQSAGHIQLRLEMTQGLWRIDYLALTQMDGPVTPSRLNPVALFRLDSSAVTSVSVDVDSTRPLCTLPGDTYRFRFELPADPASYEYFLESRGYYIEWMREEWLAEEDPGRALEMFTQPDLALRQIAPEYKRLEGEMEQSFWNSRYAR